MKKSILLKVGLGLVIVILCLFAAFTIYKRNSEKLPVRAEIFQAPEASSKSWEQVFRNPVAIEVERLDTGGVRAMKSSILNMKHPKAKELADENMELRVFSFLIHHDKFGDYLVDAGLDASVQQNPYGNLRGFLAKKISQGYSQEKGMDMASQLKKRKVDLKGIFFTHLHYDHTSGLPGLPASIRCYMGKNEQYWNYKFLYENDTLKGFNNLSLFDFSKAPIMAPFGPAIDIFGDGSLWAISTPGHTKDHISYLVNSKKGVLLITGDACSVKYGIESGIGPGTFSSNVETAQISFDRIREFHKAHPQVKMAFGHEK